MSLNGWSTAAASNANVGAINWAEGMSPGAVNNSARQMMADIANWYRNDAEWIDRAETPIYVGASQFKISGVDVTGVYTVGRRVRLIAPTPGTIYGTVTVSAFSSDTTITVVWDSTTLTNETLTSVSVALINSVSGANSIYVSNIHGISTYNYSTLLSTSSTGWKDALAYQAGSSNLTTLAAINVTTAGGALLDDADAATQRATLGLGSMSTQSSTGVSITGGAISGVTGIAFTKSYTSSQQTITSGGSLTLSHSLSAAPYSWSVDLTCTSSEGGYSANDVLTNALSDYNAGRGVSCVGDATNLNIRYGANGWVIPNKGTGGAFGPITNASWKATFKAWV